jgi:hypothetical protein
METNDVFYKPLIANISLFLPTILTSLFFIVVGLILSQIAFSLILSLITLLKLERILVKIKLATDKEISFWTIVFAQIVRWSVLTIFIVTAIQVLGLSQLNTVLTGLIVVIPNILISIFILFAGVMIANLVTLYLQNRARATKLTIMHFMAGISRWVILFFTIITILNQLGIAQELIHILFMGIVFALSLSFGLAFGLGGKETAAEILQEIKGELKKKKLS